MLAFLFLAIAIAVRLLPLLHYTPIYNFTPVGASLLFFGAKQPRKWMWVPVVALAASDIVLNRYVYHYAISWETFASSAWYLMAVGLGSLLRKNADKFQIGYIAGASLAGSISFFIISNFAVWVSYPQTYPHSFAGLVACYVAAIPFFGGTLSSDLLYTIGFFGAPHLIEIIKKQLSGEASIDDDIAAV